MSLTLNFGVIDVPYAHDAEGTTTGDVAEILEGKYGVMQHFYNAHEREITDYLTEAVVGALESAMMGANIGIADVFAAGESQIEDAFKTFLSSAEIESMGVPGVPTKAALERRSARFKKGKAKNQRPSFIDTGTYQASFKAWVDDE